MSSMVTRLASGSSVAYQIGGTPVLKIEVPAAPSAITVGTSPFTYTNTSNGIVIVLVSGGTVSSIEFQRGAFTSGSLGTSGMFVLAVGDSLIVTYSAAPSMELVPLLS